MSSFRPSSFPHARAFTRKWMRYGAIRYQPGCCYYLDNSHAEGRSNQTQVDPMAPQPSAASVLTCSDISFQVILRLFAVGSRGSVRAPGKKEIRNDGCGGNADHRAVVNGADLEVVSVGIGLDHDRDGGLRRGPPSPGAGGEYLRAAARCWRRPVGCALCARFAALSSPPGSRACAADGPAVPGRRSGDQPVMRSAMTARPAAGCGSSRCGPWPAPARQHAVSGPQSWRSCGIAVSSDLTANLPRWSMFPNDHPGQWAERRTGGRSDTATSGT